MMTRLKIMIHLILRTNHCSSGLFCYHKFQKKYHLLLLLFLYLLKSLSLDAKSISLNEINSLSNLHFSIIENTPIKNYKNFNWDTYLVYSLHLLSDSGYTVHQIYNTLYREHIEQYKIKQVNKKRGFYLYKHKGFPFENNNLTPYQTTIIKKKTTDSLFRRFYFQNFSIEIHHPQRLIVKKQLKQVLKFYQSPASEFAKQLATVVKIYHTYTNYTPLIIQDKTSQMYSLIIENLLECSVKEIPLNNYLMLVDKLVATFDDTHSYFTFSRYSAFKLLVFYKAKYFAPILFNDSDGHVICLDFDSSLVKNISKGDTVITVNNTKIKDYINNQFEYISCPEKSKYDYILPNKFIYSYNRTDTFKLGLASGNIAYVKLSTARTPFYGSTTDLTSYRYINDTTLLINAKINQLKLREVRKQLENRLITTVYLDIGNYPDYKLDKLLSYLIIDTLHTANFGIKTYYSDNTTTWDDTSECWYIIPQNTKQYKLFVYSYNAVSYAETILEMLKYYKAATLLGNKSIGTNGDIAVINTPLGSFCTTGLKVSRNGIRHTCVEPDIELPNSILKSSLLKE